MQDFNTQRVPEIIAHRHHDSILLTSTNEDIFLLLDFEEINRRFLGVPANDGVERCIEDEANKIVYEALCSGDIELWPILATYRELSENKVYSMYIRYLCNRG